MLFTNHKLFGILIDPSALQQKFALNGYYEIWECIGTQWSAIMNV